MKKVLYLLWIYFFTVISYSQSIVINNGASIYVNSGADICAGTYGNISGNIFGEGTQCGDSVLPVELVSFNAVVLDDNNIELNWMTATELNNYGFELERRTDKSNWEKIGFINGSGNSTTFHEYSFIDRSCLYSNKFLYRLKQIDFDGTFTYSDEIEAAIIPNDFLLYQNFPNPFNPTTKIKFTIPASPLSFGEGQGVRLIVYDILGNEIATLVNEEKPAGEHEVEFDASGLTSGIYFYKLQAGNFVETKKMVLLK